MMAEIGYFILAFIANFIGGIMNLVGMFLGGGLGTLFGLVALVLVIAWWRNKK